MSDTGRPLPKFGEWDVNDPASAEGYTVIFNKARNDKKTGGGKPESPAKVNPRTRRPPLDPSKTQSLQLCSCDDIEVSSHEPYTPELAKQAHLHPLSHEVVSAKKIKPQEQTCMHQTYI
ncbi:Protein NOI4 [Glycine max]|nr:Protein NOI4 [Glycine max]